MAFVRRKLDFTIYLGLGTFGENGTDIVKLSGHRATFEADIAGGPGMVNATIRIYGVALSIINQVTTLGNIATTTRRNSVLVEAGDEGGIMSAVFTGTIRNAWADFNEQPETVLALETNAGFLDAIKPATSISFKGSADVAAMLNSLATQLGLKFENNGVALSIHNPNYHGSLRQQAWQIVRDAGIEWNSMADNVLAIWNPGQFRNTGSIPVIGPETGMIGYPTYMSNGLQLRTIFNPAIGFGQRFQLKSSLITNIAERSTISPLAFTSVWGICALGHSLESEMPGGKWETTIWAAPPGYPMVPTQ